MVRFPIIQLDERLRLFVSTIRSPILDQLAYCVYTL